MMKIEEKVKIVHVREDVHEDIKITEKADGSKITEIVRNSRKSTDKLEKSRKITKPVGKNWLFDLRGSKSFLTGGFSGGTLTLGVSRKVLPGLFMGVYGDTDGQIGLGLTINF